MPKKILILYNPRSGQRFRRADWKRLKNFFPEQEYNVSYWDLDENNIHGAEGLGAYDLFVVVGGDGTIRHVVHYLLCRGLDIPLGIIPRGSANLLAKSIGIPRSLRKAAGIIAAGKIIAIDAARTSGGEYFVSAFAAGYLSRRALGAHEQIKKRIGLFGYLLSFFFEIRYPFHEFRFTVDGMPYTVRGHSLFILNTEKILGFRSARMIDYRDGFFEIIVTTNKKFLTLIRVIYDFYFTRAPSKHFFITTGRHFEIATSDLHPLLIDGDQLRHADSVVIDVVPCSVRIFSP